MRDMNVLHNQAIMMRKDGISYGAIADKLKISKSTASLWLRDIKITDEQQEKLHQDWIEGLVHARTLASQRHRDIRRKQLEHAEIEAQEFLQDYEVDGKMLEIFLAGLYLGDGFKTNGRLGFGNADPTLVKMFVILITRLYPIDGKRLKIQLFVRVDQNIDETEKYWASLLEIPRSQFHRTQVDKRAIKPTVSGYHGVCAVVYPDTQLQRRILAIGKEMVKYISTLQ